MDIYDIITQPCYDTIHKLFVRITSAPPLFARCFYGLLVWSHTMKRAVLTQAHKHATAVGGLIYDFHFLALVTMEKRGVVFHLAILFEFLDSI